MMATDETRNTGVHFVYGTFGFSTARGESVQSPEPDSKAT
jgi:hypothetical protein